MDVRVEAIAACRDCEAACAVPLWAMTDDGQAADGTVYKLSPRRCAECGSKRVAIVTEVE